MPKPHPYRARDGTVTWRVRFRHGGRFTSETFASREKAAEFARWVDELGPDEAVAAREDGGRSRWTLDDVAAEFWDWKATRVRSDRTVPDYRRDYDRWIGPRLGHRPIDGISQRDVQRWVDDMHSGLDKRPPAAPKSIADRHALLSAIYAYAAGPARSYVTDNPCAGTDLPPKRRRPPKGLRPAEWQALAPALRQINPDAADLAAFLLASGWRWSEAIALPVRAVEDHGHAVHVSVEQVVRRNAAGQHVIVDDTKAAGSDRRVQLDADTAGLVRARIVGRHPDAPVFTTAEGAQWHYSNFLRRYWNPAVAAANLSRRPTPHWLRHTAVYWLVLSGASLAEVQARIGHRSITTTIGVYGQMLADVQPATLDAFAALRDGPVALAGTVVAGEVVRPPCDEGQVS